MNASLSKSAVLSLVISVVGCGEQHMSRQPVDPAVADEQNVEEPAVEERDATPTLESTESRMDEERPEEDAGVGRSASAQPQLIESADRFAEERQRMVDVQMAERDISNPRVLSAMRRVPRHEFVPEALREFAYHDQPLPIGHEQTISQPYIVALMTQLVDPKADARALDIGTGSGYQAAVLAELVDEVYSIEIVRPLADTARERLKRLGYNNVEVICGDGYQGLLQQAPFDVIVVAAAPDHVPEPLIRQLAPKGRLVIPVGTFFQELLVIEKLDDGSVRKETVAPVRFVPMTGEALKKQD